MSASTTYSINVRYRLEGNVDKKADKVSRSFNKAGKSASNYGRSLKRLAVLAASGYGIGLAKKHLIDYNASLQETKLTMTGLLKLNLGGTWASNQMMANDLIGKFKVDAKASAGTMKDFADFAQLVTGPVTRAGMSMTDLRDITKGGVVAAKAFGIEAEVAARDIEQALAGTLGQKDRFARALLEPMGITTKEWNKIMKKSPQQAAKMLVDAFNQPALKQMAEAYKDTWAGATSSLEDNIQQALGKVGMPLMKALTKEAQKVGDFFDKNPEKVEKFITKFSEGLMTGFRFMKKVVMLIVDNASLLMDIAKAYIGFKIISGGAGLLGAGIGGLGGMAGNMGKASKATGSFATKMGAAASRMNAIGMILGGVYAGASIIAGAVDRGQDRDLNRVAGREQHLLDVGSNFATGGSSKDAASVIRSAKSSGIVSGGEINLKKFLEGARGGSVSDKEIGFARQGNQISGRADTDLNAVMYGNFKNMDKRTKLTFMGLQKALKVHTKEMDAAFSKFAISHQNILADFLAEKGGLKEYFMSGNLIKDFAVYGGYDKVLEAKKAEEEADGKKKTRGTKKNGATNVYINTIKVASDNPDRFAVHLIGAFKSANTRPVSSRLRLPGGRQS